MIPRTCAVIEWSETDAPGPPVFDVLVYSAVAVEGHPEGRPGRRPNCTGCVSSDWLRDPRSSPEGAYALWADGGFLTTQDHIGALRALAKIEGCDWASIMADALTLYHPVANDAA